jgi:hypothetical protein
MKKAWAIIITSLINVERIRNNCVPISYNFELDRTLRTNNVSDSWYYAQTDKSINWTIEGRDRYCNIEGCHYKPVVNNKTYNYMMRDTYKDSIPKIFRMRVNQRDCKSTEFVNGKKCSWYFAYFPVFLQNFTSFACKSLNYQGTWVPDNLIGIQNKAFFCYFDTLVYYWN